MIGLLITGAAGHLAGERRERVIQTDLDVQASALVDRNEVLLRDALGTAARIDQLAANRWPSPEGYRSLAGSFGASLPGDWFAGQMVAVAPAELSRVIAAEQVETPGFDTIRLRDVPLPIGHVLLLRATGEAPTGSDVSSYAGVAEQLAAMEIGTPTFAGTDVRRPGPPVAGQLQVQRRSLVTGPLGTRADGWSVVQIDVGAIFQSTIAELDSAYGVDFALSVNPEMGSGGIDESSAVGSVTHVRSIESIEFTAEVWTDGSDFSGLDQRSAYGLGFVLTLLTVAITAAGYRVRALRHRARMSDQTAREDPLTGLKNRRWLMEYLEARAGDPVAVLFCDIDRFKVVNDSAGHAVGDELLVGTARRIEAAVGDESWCVRFGGDEFIVVSHVVDGNPHDVGLDLADRLVAAMSEPVQLSTGERRATLSVGVAAAGRDEAISPQELIRCADVALGRCKAAGRNTVAVYDESLREAELDRLAMESDLQHSLDTSDFVVHYQPIVSSGGAPLSFESLVRWRRPDGELIPPGVFLPVVSEIGRMRDLGAIVLHQALSDFEPIAREHHGLTIHVNVDPVQLSDPDFPELVEHALVERDLDPSRLVIELVEHEWMDLAPDTNEVLRRLSALGIGVSIDDFGTGYSSLARTLQVDGLVEIKLDRSLTAQVADPRTEAMIAGLVDTARRLGVALTAEGIETREELDGLTKAGVTRFQGYLFARPGPTIEVSEVSEATGRPSEVENTVDTAPKRKSVRRHSLERSNSPAVRSSRRAEPRR